MSQQDVIDVEVIEDEPTVAALHPVPVKPSTALVTPAAAVADIEQAFRDYTALCDRLLDKTDYQRIGDKDFRKKSAWRKLAVAFGVTCQIVDRAYERDGRLILRAEVVVRATAPNGRSMDGLGACDLFEKCCRPGCRKRHTHCSQDCPGTVHFSNPQHDIPATAATRATNRACADLFGMGEVSAEEVTQDVVPERLLALVARHEALPEDKRDRLTGFMQEKVWNGSKIAMTELPESWWQHYEHFIDKAEAPANEPDGECAYCRADPCECAPGDVLGAVGDTDGQGSDA